MNTRDLMDIALELAGLKQETQDAEIIVAGENINNVLAGIDMNTPELLIAKMMHYDCVVSHHPRNVRIALSSNLFREQMFAMEKAGIPLNYAQKLIDQEADKSDKIDHSFNADRNATAAQVLEQPFMCIHTPADLIVEKALQKRFDDEFGDKPYTKLKDIIESLNKIPEYKNAYQKPMIAIGGSESYAGKIHVLMSGVTEGGPEVLKAYFKAGIGTLVTMHLSEASEKAIAEQGIGNVIVAGHMASDSYGMNRIFEAWESKGIKVTRMSGLVSAD